LETVHLRRDTKYFYNIVKLFKGRRCRYFLLIRKALQDVIKWRKWVATIIAWCNLYIKNNFFLFVCISLHRKRLIRRINTKLLTVVSSECDIRIWGRVVEAFFIFHVLYICILLHCLHYLRMLIYSCMTVLTKRKERF